ncbi:unnamed protein product [Ixodes pacificus]
MTTPWLSSLRVGTLYMSSSSCLSLSSESFDVQLKSIAGTSFGVRT